MTDVNSNTYLTTKELSRGRADEARYQTKQMQIHTDHLQKSR